MNCYEALDVDETTPVQYVGVYVMRWQPEWGNPTVAFRESTVAEDLLEALEKIVVVVGAHGCTNKGIYVSMPGEYTLMIDSIAKTAIAKATGEP